MEGMPHLHWSEWRSGRLCFLDCRLFSRRTVDHQLASCPDPSSRKYQVSNRRFAGFRWGQCGHVSSAAFSFRCGAIRCGANSLKLALHFCGTLTDIHRLAHCNERGRARADVRRVDNGDNLRRRNVNHGASWPSERDEKISEPLGEPLSYIIPLSTRL
jgi:hypothetical protein